MSASKQATELNRQLTEALSDYRRSAGSYDELLADDGSVRPAWQPILEHLAGIKEAERPGLQETAERLFRENGVTFVAQDDAKSTSRPWQFDPFPVLITPDDWRKIESGLIQRAQILDKALADLYGPQRLLRDGIVAPGAVFGNSQYLRPCRDTTPAEAPEGSHLQFIAFDLARSPDGNWWVLSDRTEAPSGAGYALENRIVASHCLPDLFRNQNVMRQAGFFRSFNEQFLSRSSRDEPLSIFLSRGPTKRTYFEHAYLARYLGYSLVEGSDLTVRDDKVYLKTVEGLQPVDLILRTIRSDMSDPLELRGDSLVGVPGLLQAVRGGNVIVGNAIGSGLVESDAFLSFLPAMSKYFSDGELEIPSVATWWCGQDSERQYVLDNLEHLAIRRVSTTRSLLAGGKDGRVVEDKAALAEQIRARGYDFVGQEEVALSTAPVWNKDGRLKAAPVTVRFYVAATADGFRVMPGGLARVSDSSANPHANWLAAGDVSKDTWVLSDEPVETYSLLSQRNDAGLLHRSGRDLPSRAADNMFWLGRYTERAEAAVRLLRSLVIRMSGEMGAHRSRVSTERIAGLLVAQKHLSPRRGKRATEAGRDAIANELWSILFDQESKDGLATVLGNVKRTADATRERLSYDTYRILLEMSEVPRLSRYSGGRDTDRALRILNRLTQYLAAFSGLAMENMTRGYGWRFLEMGRRIERVRTIHQLVQHLTIYGDPENDGGLELLLELADSTMTYRRRYHATPQLARVLDLLIADDSNPRSVVFQLRAVLDHLEVLPHTDGVGLMSPDQRIAKRLETDLSLADWLDLSSALNRFNARVRLDRRLRQINTDINELSDQITQRFFSHSTAKRL